MTTQSTQSTESLETSDGLNMFWGDKPREVQSTWSGFTPAPDALIKKYSYVTALVWGRVWRYCQMSDGICRAAIDTIADELGMSYKTIMRHIEPLCDDGYLEDTTPEIRNKPHVYADTGLLIIRISVGAEVNAKKKLLGQRVRAARSESPSDTPTESDEESIKKEIKKETVLSEQDLEDVNRKVDKILELNLPSVTYWKGREYFRENHLHYADWYNKVTGQVCGKSSQRAWQKAFSAWQSEELEITNLEAARTARLRWKEFIVDPNELTKDAAAIKAQSNLVANMNFVRAPQTTGSSTGYYA